MRHFQRSVVRCLTWEKPIAQDIEMPIPYLLYHYEVQPHNDVQVRGQVKVENEAQWTG